MIKSTAGTPKEAAGAEQLGGVGVVRSATARRPPPPRGGSSSRLLLARELRARELRGSETAAPSGVEPYSGTPEPAAEKHVEDLRRVDFLLRVVRRSPVPPAVRRINASPASSPAQRAKVLRAVPVVRQTLVFVAEARKRFAVADYKIVNQVAVPLEVYGD